MKHDRPMDPLPPLERVIGDTGIVGARRLQVLFEILLEASRYRTIPVLPHTDKGSLERGRNLACLGLGIRRWGPDGALGPKRKNSKLNCDLID